ncbi:MAG: hypothetical protein QM749_10130 [Aquabacterium sp.]
MLARRPFLQLSLTGLVALHAPEVAWSGARVVPRAESPLVGVDPVIQVSGLTARWESAMRRDLGWSARWSAMDTHEVLDQLEQGQIDAGLFLSHPKADALDKQGLIHNRQTLARTEVLLLGPDTDVAGIRAEADPGLALKQVLAAHEAGAAQWVAPPAGSALAVLADQLTQGMASKARPAQAIARVATGKGTPPTYRLLTRAEFLHAPPKGPRLRNWWSQDAHQALDVQVACSFRARHAGAKLLVSWLQWPLAQSAVTALQPAWQRVKG